MLTALRIPPTLTALEAAEVLGVGLDSIYRYHKLGYLSATRLGGTLRISQASVENLLVTGIERKPRARNRSENTSNSQQPTVAPVWPPPGIDRHAHLQAHLAALKEQELRGEIPPIQYSSPMPPPSNYA